MSASAVGRLGLVTVPSGSQLIIGDPAASPSAITLDASGIIVYGSLRAGSATCRLQSSVTITLHGARPSTKAERDALPPWHKGIYVQDGTLDLHGRQYARTWARLARTVAVGDDTIYLQATVNWEAGQQVVLVTTAMKDSRDWHHNEVMTVARVLGATELPAGAIAAVQLTSAAHYEHLAIDAYQGEVGLLTRIITIQGAATDSEPNDIEPVSCEHSRWILGSRTVPCATSSLTGFGAHVLVTGQAAIARVAGVEFYRVGQTNVLARYPMHFHVMGNAGQHSYVTDSSVHRSYYRCVSIHGTNQVLVSSNVGYDVIGYCMYLEDGVEELNRIEYNLVAHVHFIGTPARSGSQFMDDVAQSDDLTLPADVTAAPFYITNSYNYIVGNAASGGWAGFAFPELPSPIKTHRHLAGSVTPNARPLLLFDGNTAHSSSYWWGNAGLIYFGGKLRHPDPASDALVYNGGRSNPPRDTCEVEPCTLRNDCRCPNDRTIYQRITNTKVFLSPGVGVLHWGKRPEIVGYEAHDVALSLSILGFGFISNALVRCRTGAN